MTNMLRRPPAGWLSISLTPVTNMLLRPFVLVDCHTKRKRNPSLTPMTNMLGRPFVLADCWDQPLVHRGAEGWRGLKNWEDLVDWKQIRQYFTFCCLLIRYFKYFFHTIKGRICWVTQYYYICCLHTTSLNSLLLKLRTETHIESHVIL